MVFGCAERKDCHFICHEEALGRLDEGNCGHAEEVTEEVCLTHEWCGRKQRVAWGEEPKWCVPESQDPPVQTN